MDKCSVLLCGFLLVLPPVLSQSANINTLSYNTNILNQYCQPASRNVQSVTVAFQPICQNSSPTECCNYLSAAIVQHKDLYLCARNIGYTFARNCRSTVDEQIAVRIDESSFVFPRDPHDGVDTLNAQQISSTSPRLGTTTRSDNRPVQGSIPQNTWQSSVVPLQPRPASSQDTRQPINAQPAQSNTFQFNFGNAQDAVRVPIAQPGSPQNNGFSQRPSQPSRLPPQRPSPQSISQGNDNDDDYDDKPIVETNTAGYQAMEFALNLFKNLDRSPNSDSVISPLLPQLLLSNLVDYASPVAQAQLQKTIVLHPTQLASIASKLDRISKSTVNTIETASANFVAQDVNLNKTYTTDARTRNVEVKRVDFSQPHAAARTANNWVSSKTRNLINEILNPSTINPYTRLLLVNTIYFKGMWKYTFIESNPGTFESLPNQPRQLNKMFQLNKLRYGELSFPDNNGLRWVELPYEGNNLAMLVFLPTVRHQLEASLRQLKPYDLAKVMAELQAPYINTKVHLHMPKFTLTDSVSLIPALKRMGLHSIFQDADALQYITNESTVVSDVTQRSYMSVDEFGTKATSVASLSIITLSITPQYRDVRFDVDQPFLVMIVDKQERYPFFIGQINDPKE